MAEVELEFRLSDDSIICSVIYSPCVTISELKEMLVSHWPRDKVIVPRLANDLELTFEAKLLNNRETLADSVLPHMVPGENAATIMVEVRPIQIRDIGLPPLPPSKNKKPLLPPPLLRSQQAKLQFRIYDGMIICRGTYSAVDTILRIKQKLVNQWPQGKTMVPKIALDLKFLWKNKFLYNSETVASCGLLSNCYVDDPQSVVTVHVFVDPYNEKMDRFRMSDDERSCTIL